MGIIECPLPKAFYNATITLKSKLDKEPPKKIYRSIYLMNVDAKILNKIANWIQQHTKKCHTPQPSGIHYKFTRMIPHKQINVIHLINKIKTTQSSQLMQKKHLTKFNIPSLQKLYQKSGYWGNIIKAVYDKPTASIILKGEKLKALLLKSKTRQGCPFSPLLLNTVVLEVVATAVRSEKDIKGTQIGRKNLNCPYMQMTWFYIYIYIYI